MPIGPLMLDIAGLTLTKLDEQLLSHPFVGGVILFTRNAQSLQQLQSLCQAIRHIRPEALIAVDQEGGRVQRFTNGFTRLPSLQMLGKLAEINPEKATHLSQTAGWLMATEVLHAGLDISFAPVLDLDHGLSGVIGSRAFHSSPTIVETLARAFIQGMSQAGMRATGKHFPGHGGTRLDSHTAAPVDTRTKDELADDLHPFAALAEHDLHAIMPAHIIFPKIDALPAGFSRHWLQTILRKQLHFQGAIISDDLTMMGAQALGNIQTRAGLALTAGCDMILVCNDREAVMALLDNLPNTWTTDNPRLQALRRQQKQHIEKRHDNPRWQQACHELQQLEKRSL
jgi:beta-N-acetylhexosaminidase